MSKKISELTAVTDVTPSDLFQVVDVEDPAMASSGTNKKVTAQTLGNYLPVRALGTTTSRTLSERFGDAVNVKDFGAAADGIQDDTAAFQAAAAIGKTVFIPKGTYLISSAISTAAVWRLDKGAIISGLPNKGTAGGGVMDTSRLTGSIISSNSGGINVLKVGDSDPWLTEVRDTVDYLGTFASVSSTGSYGGVFATRSSDNTTPNMQTIGIGAFAVNDNTQNPEPSWNIYTEAIRFANTGPAFGAEMDFVNLGNTNNLTPYSIVDAYSSVNAPTVNLWLSCGGGDSGLAVDANNISAAIAFLPNIKQFNAGIVVRSGSISSGDIVRAPSGYNYTWQTPSFITSTIDDRQHYRAVYSNDTGLMVSDISRKYKSNGTDPTVLGEAISSFSNEGYFGAAPYVGTKHSTIQETDFESGAARFRYAFAARNSDGGFTEVGINYGGNARFCPATDNNIGLGASTNRWNTVFASKFNTGIGNVFISSGTGSPEGVVTADTGSLYTNISGGANTTLYVKTSGTGNTGWTAK